MTEPYAYSPGDQPTLFQQPMLLLRHAGSVTVLKTYATKDELEADELEPGRYEVWRFGGTFTVEVVPQRTRAKFESAVKRPRASDPSKPKKPRSRKPPKSSNAGSS